MHRFEHPTAHNRVASHVGQARGLISPSLNRSGVWCHTLALPLLLVALGLDGCGRVGDRAQVTNAPAQPRRVVLDYRNGWQHPSDGKQSVAEIAHTYEREPELLAQLNSLSVNEIPTAGLRLYIPPTDDPKRLREVLGERGRESGLEVFFPSPAYSTDNAAMIAGLGWQRLAAGARDGWDLDASPS